MFTTKPRPVPSKAALRVLYQLAYISSGTAVGAGVLCAEERRRRTQIVQRIADNAKRIRQHPRYAANAAVAVREEGEVVFEGGEDMPVEEGDKKMGRRSMRERYEEAVKGQHLPSVVEEEYGVVVGRERKKKAKRSATRTTSPAVVHDQQGLTGSTDEHVHATPLQVRRSQEPTSKRGPTKSTIRPLQREVSLGVTTSADSRHENFRQKPSKAITELTSRCRELLSQRRISAAVDTYAQVVQHRAEGDNTPNVFNEIFYAALESKLFWRCSELLRMQEKVSPLRNSHFEALVYACDSNDENNVILDLLLRIDPTFLSSKEVHPKVRAILAKACAADVSLLDYFETLYDSLDNASRDAVDKQRRHLLLTATWRRTKNLETVNANLRPLVEHMRRMGKKSALREIDKIMAEIYIKANRTLEALDSIASLHRTGRSGNLHCMLLAAYAYASRNAWDSFSQVLRLAESVPLENIRKDDRIMHNLVLSYSLHHTASQTWKFVGYLRERFGYSPNRSTHRSVLGAFVSHKAVGLVPRWLRLHKLDGQGLKMDSRTAAQLLGRYYRNHRPSHVLVMWFCRNLAHMVPDFDPQDFISLVTQSIGYDLSGAFERNAVWQQAHAQQRLERLRTAEHEILSPGYTYSRELHFEHPNARTGDQESVEQAPKSSPYDVTALEQSMIPSPHKTSPRPTSHSDKMYIALSSQRYREVLNLYDASLDIFRVPHSASNLILAVRASIKLHGDDEHAQQMIQFAERAGLNVTGAMAPVLIYRMQNFDPADPLCAPSLRDMAMRYYKAAENNGFVPALDVGITAANALIASGYAQDGVKLLRSILEPNPAVRRKSINIVFMTVMVKGYIALGSIWDVVYWAHEALRSRVLMSPNFVRELKRGLRRLSSSRRDRAQLGTYIDMCKERRREQAIEANILGKKLVATIARCMREEAPVEIDLRKDLDAEFFGRTFTEHPAPAGEETDEVSSEWIDKPRLTRRERLALSRERVAKMIRHDPSTDFKDTRQSNRLTDVQWMRQYRAFLRQPMVLEDGQYVSFRYYLPSQSTKWRGRERISRAKSKQTAEKFGWDHVRS